MILNDREVLAQIKCLENEVKHVSDRYWDLAHRHNCLLKHLGLSEYKKPSEIVLVVKGGPEPD